MAQDKKRVGKMPSPFLTQVLMTTTKMQRSFQKAGVKGAANLEWMKSFQKAGVKRAANQERMKISQRAGIKMRLDAKKHSET